MASHRVAGAPLDFVAIRDELEVPGDFAAPVQAEAEAAAAHPDPPDAAGHADPNSPVVDATDIPFVTIDPAGSRDLDQALHIARLGDGYRVHYAIADVAAFVRPGSALDAEAFRRGETLYFPDARVPLHPLVLSEGAASLLPDQVRPAVLWQIDLDANGEVTAVDVHRARVRSQRQFDYETVQRLLDGPSPPDQFVLLREVGQLGLARARADHAIDLGLPEQQVVADGPGAWTIRYRSPLEVEAYNAQISILTGRCAARLMLDHHVGVLRTVPAPTPGAVHALQRAARALHVPWPHGAEPGDVLATLDRSRTQNITFVEHASALLRGSGYVAF
ncbi:MAG TPA: RNB domain-containing ribonuclease, partial [Paraburkholderia sp.]|nr:RNB domain-containing ribonuclease [Paraburkholderia sp.]